MNLLFIRSSHDDFTKKASQTAQKIIDKLIDQHINFIELKDKDATRQKVIKAFENNPIDFVIHYGHADEDSLKGDKGEKLIDMDNMNEILRVNGVKVSTLSCLSASQLGPASINDAKTNAYLGYKTKIAFPDKKNPFFDKFTEAFNSPNFELLTSYLHPGSPARNFKAAYDKGIETFSNKYNEVVTAAANNPNEYDPRVVTATLFLINQAWEAFTKCGNDDAEV